MIKLLVICALCCVFIVKVEPKPFIIGYSTGAVNNNNNYDPLADFIKRILSIRVTKSQTLLVYLLKQSLDPDVPRRKSTRTTRPPFQTTTPLVTVFSPDEQFNKEEKDKISKEITSAADDKDNEIWFNVKKDDDNTSKGDNGDKDVDVIVKARQPFDYIDLSA
ncbi:hypothetical protein ACFFRR_001831 [Megaselia abdita]